MPIFRVLRRVDAYVDYVAEVEARTADEASFLADDDETRFKWEEVGISQFDARMFVTLDTDDNEIEETMRSDF